MGVVGKRIIFIGPDCGGKSSLCTAYARQEGQMASGHRKIENSMAMLVTVTTDAMVASKRLETNTIRDQWPFPVDLLYCRHLLNVPSPLEGIEGYLSAAYHEAGFIFVYVTASAEVLQARFNERGDELWTIDQINKIAAAYEQYYTLNPHKQRLIKIDTSSKSVEELLSELTEQINTVHTSIGGIEHD